MRPPSVIPVLPASATPRAIVGGADVLATSIDVARGARHTLDLDTFRPTRARNLEAVAAARARDVDVRLRLDTENVAPIRAELEHLGSIAEYGDDPFKQHAKAITADAADAFVATDVSDVKSLQRMEFGIRFGGPAAAALQGVQRLAPDSPAAMADDVFDAARGLGVLANDPRNGRRDVSRSVRAVIRAARDEVWVASKLFDSSRLGKDLVAAADRGARTTLVTHEIARKDAKRLAKAGVTVQVVPHDAAVAATAALHGTVVAGDDVAVMTSMPLADRAISGSKGRRSRELGVAVDGAVAADLVARARAALDAVRP